MIEYCILHRPAFLKPNDEPMAYICSADSSLDARDSFEESFPDSEVVWVHASKDIVLAALTEWRRHHENI